jgi:AraC-like DNA-binding protein
MRKYKYENHIIEEPQLPFIFHRQYRVSGRTNTPNWHTNIELLYCFEGRGFIRCGATTTPFTPGDIFVVNPDTPHGIGSDSAVHYRCLIIDNSFFAENGIPIGQLVFQSLIRDASLCQLFDAITEAYDKRDAEDFCAIIDIRYAVLGLLQRLCRQYATPGKREDRTDEYVKKAISYIRQNLSDPISLDAVAEYAGISKFHLSRQFKAYTGNTVIGTVNAIRCNEARRLIEGGMPVSAAATACGFENLSYFTRTFKKHFQELPSNFLPKR